MIFDITLLHTDNDYYMWIILFWLLLLLCCKSSYVSKSETISFPTLDVSGPWRGRHIWGFQSGNPSSSFSSFTRRFFGWTSHQYGCHQAVFFHEESFYVNTPQISNACIYIYKCCIWYWWFLSARSLRHEDDAQHRMHRKIRGRGLPSTGQMYHITFYNPTCMMSSNLYTYYINDFKLQQYFWYYLVQQCTE